ncbi:MAG: YqgE/AlgH family protein [Aeromonas sp.]
MPTQPTYLANHFLLAMPSLDDPYFSRSLVYLCVHDEHEAMGLVINLPVDLDVASMLKQLKISAPVHASLSQPVMQGGPVHSDRGFVLHTPLTGFSSSVRVCDELMITTSKDILETLGSPQAPDQWLVALGHAGWSAGQLEQEIAHGSWLVIPADPKLIFNTPIHQRWHKAAQSLGFDPVHLSHQIGHS